MKKSRELNMSIPELTDKIDVREISENFELIDKILSANLIKRNKSTTEINVTAYPPYYIMKNTEDTPIDYFEHIFEETFTLEPLEEKKFFINAPQSVYITSDVQIEYDYFIPVQEAIDDISSGATSNYEELDNQPQINGNVLSGNKTASDLGLADINDIPDISSSENNGNIKINGTEITVYAHPSGTNPHGTTKSDVGLGNVPNVATNDQTISYTEASSLAKLTSGEKLSVAFGKISKAVTDLIPHLADSVKHITSTERTNWNAAKTKADTNETNISKANTQIADIFNRCTGGKNLIDFKNLKYARSGSTSYKKTDDSITVTSNNSWASVGYYLPNLEIGKQYKLSFKITNFSYSSGAVKIRLSGTSGGTGNVNKDVIITADGEYSASFTVTDSNVYKFILFYPNFSEKSNVNSFTCSELMLKFAESGDDTYVPYIPTNAEITNGWTTTNLSLGASSNIDLYFVREECQVVMHYNNALKKVIIDIDFKTKDIQSGNSAIFISLDAKYMPSKKIRSYIHSGEVTYYSIANPDTNAISVGVSTGSATANTSLSIRLEWTII